MRPGGTANHQDASCFLAFLYNYRKRQFCFHLNNILLKDVECKKIYFWAVSISIY